MIELPCAPLLVIDTNTSTNVEELKTMCAKLDLLTVKSNIEMSSRGTLKEIISQID